MVSEIEVGKEGLQRRSPTSWIRVLFGRKRLSDVRAVGGGGDYPENPAGGLLSKLIVGCVRCQGQSR